MGRFGSFRRRPWPLVCCPSLCDTVVPVSGPEVSELSKLLENAFLTVGIGLVGEIARIAHALDVSAREVTGAAPRRRPPAITPSTPDRESGATV